tara:strand:- start:7 stop:270 length:264 start_codon:yes stop_codon:yes gene_type:complete
MKLYIYKSIIAAVIVYVLFEVTIGYRITKIKSEVRQLIDRDGRVEIKNKIKDEMKKGIQKENYFTEDERVLFSTFINKIRNELNLEK